MSIVSVTNVVVRRNPARLTEPFELEVSFECLESLQEDLEWRLVYVGDPEDKSKDQELDCVALGPIQRGALRFVFIADAPNYTMINKEDINGITIILLTGSYRNQEFVRVGWYVHNIFPQPEYVENPPDVDDMSLDDMLEKMQRVILSDAPRVTRFQVEWDTPSANPAFERVYSVQPSTSNAIQDNHNESIPSTAAPNCISNSPAVPTNLNVGDDDARVNNSSYDMEEKNNNNEELSTATVTTTSVVTSLGSRVEGGSINSCANSLMCDENHCFALSDSLKLPRPTSCAISEDIEMT